jgi:hypothetical protein
VATNVESSITAPPSALAHAAIAAPRTQCLTLIPIRMARER